MIVDWWQKHRSEGEWDENIHNVVANAYLGLGEIEQAEELANGAEDVGERFSMWAQAVHDLLDQKQLEKAQQAMVVAEHYGIEKSMTDEDDAFEQTHTLGSLIVGWHALGDRKKMETGLGQLKTLLKEIGWTHDFNSIGAHGLAYEVYRRLGMEREADQGFHTMLSELSLSDPQQWEEEARVDLGIKLWAVRLSHFNDWQRIEQLIQRGSGEKRDLHHSFLIYFVTKAAIDDGRKDVARKWIQYKLDWADSADLDPEIIERDVLIGDVILALKEQGEYLEALSIIPRITEDYRNALAIEMALQCWGTGGFSNEEQSEKIQQLLQTIDP